MAGGDVSPFVLPSSLLGGVLKGEMRSSAPSAARSGAKVLRGVGSADCGLPAGANLGFAARFTGGGIGGAEAVCGPFLRGSIDAWGLWRDDEGTRLGLEAAGESSTA